MTAPWPLLTADPAGHRVAFTAIGMTCRYRARAVTEDLGAPNGVHSTDVTLGSTIVTVESDQAVEMTRVTAPIAAAGYSIAG